MKKNKVLGILVLAIVGIIFINGCIQQEKGPVKIRDQNISGEIKQDQTWSGNILVTQPGITVLSGVTLIIEPGTTVRFEHARRGFVSWLAVQGVLKAVGTSERPIRFTSDALQPEHGDWGGINLFPGSAGSVLDHAIIEFSQWGVCVDDNVTISNSIIRWITTTALVLFSTPTVFHNRIYQVGSCPIEVHYRAQPTITYNTLWGSAQVSGIRVEAYAHPIIRHNIIRNNKESGIQITWSSSATVEYNLITGNGVGIGIGQGGSAKNSVICHNNLHDNPLAELTVEPQETLIATNNWWGTTDEAAIKAKIGCGPGTTIVYKPYETSAVDIGDLTYDFEDSETYDHLPKTENDTYEYIYWENDSTRTIAGYITPPGMPDGLAWDGEFLYIATATAGSPTDSIYKLDLSGNILGSFPSPATQTMGLAFDGQNLWILDYVQRLVFQVNRSGQVIKSIPAPCNEPWGLTYDGQCLWTFTRQIQGKAYQFDTSGNTIHVIQFPCGVTALAWDGKYLWTNGGPGKLAQIDPSDGHVIRSITSSGFDTQHLTWQEPYLWAVEWGDETPEHARLIKMLPTRE